LKPKTSSIQKKHIITLAGRPGSGKSTAAKLIAERLNYQHFSSGDLFRELGKQRGMDLLQANLAAEGKQEIDRLVDEKLRDIGANNDQVVIDSRTAWHWIPSSFKVFLDLEIQLAARRILSEMSEERLTSENIPRDPIEYAKVLERRLELENKRYKALYDINPYDMTNYDLVVDTATNNIDQVAELVVNGFRDWLKS